MAFTQLYMQTTGNDMNAGSTTADAASVTSTNGSWDVTADTFIATGATPFAAVNVGDWVSIYNDGVTSGAVYVAQVTALYLSGLGVTLSTTAKYGTKPASGATGKSAKVGGAWASLAVWTSLFVSVAIPAATKVNVKLGTYANTTTARSLIAPGLTTGPFWWDGYVTSPGDLDNVVEVATRVGGTDIPLFSWTTQVATIQGNHIRLSNIAFTSARTTGTAVSVSGVQNGRFIRCQFENTGANAASSALSMGSAPRVSFTQCSFKATATATRSCAVGAGYVQFKGCTFLGGGHGIEVTATIVAFMAIQCTFRSNPGSGIAFTAASPVVLIDGCTFYGCGADGVLFTLVPTIDGQVSSCVFETIAGYGINNASGANTNVVTFFGNAFHATTSGHYNGFGDVPSELEQVDSNSMVTSATDMTLPTGALALANGLPGLFELESYRSYLDIGAVQKLITAGSSLARIIGG